MVAHVWDAGFGAAQKGFAACYSVAPRLARSAPYANPAEGNRNRAKVANRLSSAEGEPRLFLLGFDFGLPGRVPALISSMFEKPSPSESSFSTDLSISGVIILEPEAWRAASTALPYGFRIGGAGGRWHVRHLAFPSALLGFTL